MAAKVYGNAIKAAFNKEIDFDSDSIKLMLLTSAYAPNQDGHDYVDDVRAFEVTGAGYTAGGQALSARTAVYDGTTNRTTFDAADPVWPNSSVTARYAVLYDDSGASDSTKPLIAYYDFGIDKASSNGEFVARISADGLFSTTTA